jgi:hypothetical protein
MIDQFFAFALERYRIRLKRVAGEPKPWTDDPILLRYRFCNVYREHDTVTDWIRVHWREPQAENPDLWFALAVARLINWPDTLQEIGFPVPWKPARFLKVMAKRQLLGVKVYSAAYMIRSDKDYQGVSKAIYQAESTFNPLWRARKILRPQPGVTLDEYHTLIGQQYGMGSFMAAQVVADLKYVEPLRSARDWETFAASGPGSRRGLNRVLGRPKDQPWSEHEWRLGLGELRGQLLPLFRKAKMPKPHAQDIQNCCCEFDKYERVRLGEGRPRSTYNGAR